MWVSACWCNVGLIPLLAELHDRKKEIGINKWLPKQHDSGSVKQRSYNNWSSVIVHFVFFKFCPAVSSRLVGGRSHAELCCDGMGIFFKCGVTTDLQSSTFKGVCVWRIFKSGRDQLDPVVLWLRWPSELNVFFCMSNLEIWSVLHIFRMQLKGQTWHLYQDATTYWIPNETKND